MLRSPFSILIFLICIVIFLAIHTFHFNDSYLGSISSEKLWSGSYWWFVLAAFVHENLFHLVFNLYWLWLLSPRVEKVLGKTKWLIFVIVAAWISSITQFAMTGTTGIGFSGVIYAFVGLMWIARPDYLEAFKVMHSGNVKLLLGWFVLCFVLDALKIIPIANGAHFGGLIFGVIIGWWLRNEKIIRLTPALLLIALLLVPLFWAPWLAGWWNNRGIQAIKENEQSSALFYFNKAIEIVEPGKTEDIYARLYRIEILYKLHEYNAVLEEINYLQKINIFPYIYKAKTLFALGNYEAALHNYELALKSGNNLIAQLGYINCLMMLGRVEEALLLYKRVILDRPNHGAGYFGAAQASLLLDRKEDAVNYLKKAMNMTSNEVYMAIWLSIISESTKPLEKFRQIKGWTGELVKYSLGEISEAELLKSAQNIDKWKMPIEELLCEAEGYIGLRMDIQSGKLAAKQHYEAVIATDLKDFIEYKWALVRLLMLIDK